MANLTCLGAALSDRKREGQYRQRFSIEGPQGPVVSVDGRELLAFCSNDYLGLANHPEVIAALQEAAASYGVGAGASHLVSGHSLAHEAFEIALAEHTGREAALLFCSGYQANVGVITALLNRQDAIFEDRLNHASLLDGGRLSGARLHRFLHNDIDNLETRLVRAKARRKLVAVDGVFSMDGDVAPLQQLASLCSQHDAWLMVDDAHGFGVLGETGAGAVEAAGLSFQEVPVLVGTLGKALGVSGAFVAGSAELIDYLVQFARSYIYTTAMPPALAAAGLASLRLLREEPQRRQHLQALIVYFKQRAEAHALPLQRSDSAIQPLMIGEDAQAVSLSLRLKERGLLVPAIRPPTVPAGSARLRIALSAAHTTAQIDRLIEILAEELPRGHLPSHKEAS